MEKDRIYTKVTHSISIELPKTPDKVFTHLIDLSKWWPEDFIGEAIQPGSEFVFKTGDGHLSTNKVVEFVNDQRLVWLTTESRRKADGYDWSGTKFIFDLAPKGSGTELKFTYDGVVLENEFGKLVQICDICMKEMFYNFLVHGKAK